MCKKNDRRKEERKIQYVKRKKNDIRKESEERYEKKKE